MLRILGLFMMGWIGIFGWAGNRADINADQTVDAADLAELSNILAGNLDLANYALERVIVVAETGGDFDDPADAADWVAAQGPTSLTRYVILITPGDYLLNRTLEVPEYTLVKGYGTNVTYLHRHANGVDGAVVRFSGPTAYQMRIEGLDIHNGGDGTIGPVLGVLVEDCRPEIFDCEIGAQCSTGPYDAIGMRVVRSVETTSVTARACGFRGVSTDNSGGVAIGVELYDATLHAYDCSIRAFQYSDLKDAMAVTTERSSMTPGLYAYGSELWASADPGFEFYLFRYGSSGFCRLNACRIEGDNISNIPAGSSLKLVYCTDRTFETFP